MSDRNPRVIIRDFAKRETLIIREISLNSKKGKNLVLRWLNMPYPDLYYKYDNPSEEKLKAWKEIVEECQSVKGEGLCVTGGNSYSFSAAYKARDDEGDTWIIYHTSSHRYGIRYGGIFK